MNSKNERVSCYPSREQGLLLRAALLQGEDAIAAWQQWKAVVDIESIDIGSYRLLPLLYRNLSLHGVNDTLMPKLKGVYRNTWYKNQMLLHNNLAVMRAFHEGGIETIILKGGALILHYYPDYGLRPMNDFDILVHQVDVEAAIELLKKLGWIPQHKMPDKILSIHHATPFNDESGHELDLHCHLLFKSLKENADEDFWKDAISTKIGDVPTHVLNPTDQLLHVCLHAATWDPIPPIRWVADAMTIINSSPADIDWNRIVAQAQKCRLILPLKDTLTILRELLGAPVPSSILQDIQEIPISNFDRLEYQVVTSKPLPILGKFVKEYFQYLRSAEGGFKFKFLGFTRYLQYVWGLEHLWQVPFQMIIWGIRRIWFDIFRAKPLPIN